jgi:putative transposase
VKSNQARYRISTMCRTLGVSISGYYAWLTRPPSLRKQADALLGDRIEAFYHASRCTYGRPNLKVDLGDVGISISNDRLARLMRERGIVGVSRRKAFKTTRRDRDARPAPDLVDRKFVADAPNELWVADITYIPTWSGFLFLAVVLDVFSRRIVGWAMANHLRTELVLQALDMAIWRRRPENVIHHSDQGTQYTSIAFGRRCKEAGVRPSMGSVGDCYDNAMAESFLATLECELLAGRTFRTHLEARTALFDYIEVFYNRQRRHSALGYLSPDEYERRPPTATPVVP